MKTVKITFLIVLAFVFVTPSNIFAQEDTKVVESEKVSPFSVGTDIVTSYVWRGITYSGPAFQPYMEVGLGGFTIGTWASVDFTNGFNELDTYAGYSFGFGLYAGLTDYYYKGSDAFAFTDTVGSHALEANLSYDIAGFSIAANYVINDTHAGGPGSAGGDMYFELGYAFEYFDVFVGAGDGWHSESGNFELTNIGIGTSKDIKINDNFSIPLFGQVIVNPNREEYSLVVGVSF